MKTGEALESREPDTVEQPAPTVWPMVAALGVTLLFGGLVTHAIVSAVGILLSLIGAVGWWKEVLPQARVEYVPLPPPGERAGPVVPVPAAVEHLTIGEAGHRVRVPVEVQPYSAGVIGGLVGGVAMAVVALLYGLLAQGSLWYPINLLAGIAIPGMAHDRRDLHPWLAATARTSVAAFQRRTSRSLSRRPYGHRRGARVAVA
jgi:hypothetical protein